MCCLWISGLCTKSDYIEKLDKLFLKDPESDLLLDLEELSGDKRGTLARLRYINEKNVTEFGKELFTRVERYYTENAVENLKPFTRLAYRLWEALTFMLPFEFTVSEPFVSFSCADEPLYWGDEKQSRELYQYVFDYYKERS